MYFPTLSGWTARTISGVVESAPLRTVMVSPNDRILDKVDRSGRRSPKNLTHLGGRLQSTAARTSKRDGARRESTSPSRTCSIAWRGKAAVKEWRIWSKSDWFGIFRR